MGTYRLNGTIRRRVINTIVHGDDIEGARIGIGAQGGHELL